MSSMLSKTDILDRDYWNARLIKKLLTDPDSIIHRPSGQVMKYQYAVKRVEAAESTGYFQQRVREVEIQKKFEETRKSDLRASLETAIEMDFKSLIVPKTGYFLDVYSECQKQMRVYISIINMISFHDEHLVRGHHGYYADPQAELCRRIAKARPDLAFEAGIQYSNNLYGIGGISEVLAQIREAEIEEKETGEEVYIV